MITEEGVLEALRKVNDPELHRDLVSLGMVKEIKVAGGGRSGHRGTDDPGLSDAGAGRGRDAGGGAGPTGGGGGDGDADGQCTQAAAGPPATAGGEAHPGHREWQGGGSASRR